MSESYQNLGQSAPTQANQWSVLFTVPSGETYVMSTFTATNYGTTAGSFSVAHVVNGTSVGATNKELLRSSVEVQGNDTYTATQGWTFAAGDSCMVSQTAQTFAFNAHGKRIS